MIPVKAPMLYLLCSITQWAEHFSRSFWATPFILGFCVTSVMYLVFVRKKRVFQWRYLSVQHWWTKDKVWVTSAPLRWAILWVDSKPVHVGKQKCGLFAWRLYCELADIITAPSPWVDTAMLREVVGHLSGHSLQPPAPCDPSSFSWRVHRASALVFL